MFHCSTEVQAARAASMIHGMMLYKKLLESERLEPVEYFNCPVDILDTGHHCLFVANVAWSYSSLLISIRENIWNNTDTRH